MQQEHRPNYDAQKQKDKVYLKMITLACIEANNNNGVYRKLIWDFLMAKFKEVVDYKDFLYAISNLVKAGKL
jgi:hypothetical protein